MHLGRYGINLFISFVLGPTEASGIIIQEEHQQSLFLNVIKA